MIPAKPRSEVELPPDFISFISSNYARIATVQQKIREFEEADEKNKKLLRRGKFKDGFISFDSCFSDQDTTELISATIVPKIKLEESFDSIEIQPLDLNRWLYPGFDPSKEEYEELLRKFPLVSFAFHSRDSIETPSGDNDAETPESPVPAPPMIIKGVKILQETRSGKSNCRIVNVPKMRVRFQMNQHTSHPRKRRYSRKSKLNKSNASRAGPQIISSNCRDAFSQNVPEMRAGKTLLKGGKIREIGDKVDPRLSAATLNELTNELYRRYYSDSELQLTLPPLHSSVLTLLGQRPNSKMSTCPPSQSQGNGFDSLDGDSLLGIRQKQKLRRHGRKGRYGKDNDSNEDSGESAEVTRGPSAVTSTNGSQDGGGSRRKGKIIDDPHDTQMSVMSQRDDIDIEDLPKDDDRSTLGSAYFDSSLDLNARRFHMYIEESAKSLHAVLDEQLVGTEWNSGDMNDIDTKISSIKEELREYEAKFKAGNIRMKEDMWLALPRTWSRSSATFGVPTDTRLLSTINPLEYIEKYVFISEPRKLLYSLVFHRYRTMENPTGKTITYNIVPKAVCEILGRQLDQNEKDRLEKNLLHVHNLDLEISENLFRGICAVVERLFGQYCLEDCNECFACIKYAKKDKNRCHKNKRNQLEKVDLEYVAAKIKDGKVNPQLVELLQSIFDRD